ncbi:hypothetical protein [Helicobacter sp. T3_23-1056]
MPRRASTARNDESTHPLAPSAREGAYLDCHADFIKSARNDIANYHNDDSPP